MIQIKYLWLTRKNILLLFRKIQNNFFEFDNYYYYCIDRVIFMKRDSTLYLIVYKNWKFENCVKIIILQIFYRITFYDL